MTVSTLLAPMPEIQVSEGMILKLEAIDPTTGAAVTGVTARNWTIYGEPDVDTAGLNLPVVLPLLTYGPDG